MEAKAYKPRPLPPAGTDYRAEWASMERRREAEEQARSHEEFDALVQSGAGAGSSSARPLTKRSADSDEEEAMFYPPSGYRGEWFFRALCPTNPRRARRRVERVYWLSWRSLSYGVFFSGLGMMLLVLGGLWAWFGEERVRGLSVVLAGVLLCIPGFYSLFVLLMYVRGRKGYSYRQLPDD